MVGGGRGRQGRRGVGAVRWRGLAAMVATMVALPHAVPAADGRTEPGEASARSLLASLAGFALDVVAVDLGTPTTIAGPVDAVLVSWDGAPSGAVEVRAHGPAGWSPWVSLLDAVDEAPDPGREGHPSGRTVLGPVWTGPGTDAVQVRAADGTGRAAEVELLRTVDGLVDDVLDGVGELVGRLLGGPPGRPPLGAARPGPPILAPAAWGSPGWSYATAGCEAGPVTAPLARAIVHHTVTPNGYTPEQVPAMIRSMYYAHLGRGWCDIAYNFVVDAYGRIWQARTGPVDAAVVGGHARGWNTGSIGIALLGQHQPGATPSVADATAPALDAVVEVAAWQFRIHGAAPEVIGHRDVGATSCPGDLVYGRLDQLRGAVTARI